MSIKTIFPFTNAGDYSFNIIKIECIGGKARLKMLRETQHLIQPFTSDVGFTYDPLKSEFMGGVCRQKDQRPANATFGATYTTSIDGSWGEGTLTGVAYNGAVVSGGRLDLTGYAQKYVDYNNLTGIGIQTGAIRFKYTPNYSGAPSSAVGLFATGKQAGSNVNAITALHQTNGTLRIIIYNRLGGIQADNTLPAWSPVSGTQYVIEFDYDFNAGASRLFINGTQFGSTLTNTLTRDSDNKWLRIGGYFLLTYQSNCYVEDVVIFNAVQNATTHASAYTLPETAYALTSVTCPGYTQPFPTTNILNFTNAAATITGEARFILRVGSSLYYWNGLAIVASDGSYAQANTIAQIITAQPTFELAYGVHFTVDVLFDNGNTQNAIDLYDFTMVGDIGYSTDSPAVVTAAIMMDGLEGLTPTVGGVGAVKYILERNGIKQWWNGAAWATSDGTWAQSNTASEILANKATFTTEKVSVRIYSLLNGDGEEQTEIDNLEVDYNFSPPDPSAISKCIVYGNLAEIDGEAGNATVTVELYSGTKPLRAAKYKTDWIIEGDKVTVPVVAGYWEIALADTVNMQEGAYYLFYIDGAYYRRKVPVADSKNFWELESA